MTPHRIHKSGQDNWQPQGRSEQYDAERCKSAMNAANALAVGSHTAAERRHWEHVERIWRERLERACGPFPLRCSDGRTFAERKAEQDRRA